MSINKSGRTFAQEAGITSERYFDDSYFSPLQWVSYCGQVNAVRKVAPDTLLEIGVGNGIVYKILEHMGINVTSFDINSNLHPDVVGNIVDIDSFFSKESFDCVLCAEVLEHLPFDYFAACLEKVWAITRKTAVITIPRAGAYFHCNFRMPRKRFEALFRLPVPIISAEHHWEIDSANYSKMNNIIGLMEKYFIVREYYRVPEHPKQYAFILEKKQ